MIKYKLSSEFVIFENCTMPKKKNAATLIVMHDTTCSDHTSQYVEVYELRLAPKMDCMAYEHRL